MCMVPRHQWCQGEGMSVTSILRVAILSFQVSRNCQWLYVLSDFLGIKPRYKKLLHWLDGLAISITIKSTENKQKGRWEKHELLYYIKWSFWLKTTKFAKKIAILAMKLANEHWTLETGMVAVI